MWVVLDAGPVIHLSWIDGLDLLHQLFDEVLLPPAARDEVLAAPTHTRGLDRIREALAHGWLKVREVQTPRQSAPLPIRSMRLGESEAIYLAQEIRADLFITDDAAAMNVALDNGLKVTGTLGVLKAARESGPIPSVLPRLLELRRLGQWVSEQLVQEVRTEEGGDGDSPSMRFGNL
jgi:predicted nucleic acid-binding protein